MLPQRLAVAWLLSAMLCADAIGPKEGQPGGRSLVRYAEMQAQELPTVRILLTERCGTYDLMVSIFANHTKEVLGNDVKITLLSGCMQQDLYAEMPQEVQPKGLDATFFFMEELQHEMHYQESLYYTSLPRALFNYLEETLNPEQPTEEVLVIAEFDFVWLNAEKFWEYCKMSRKLKSAVAVTYKFMADGISSPDKMASRGKNKQDFRKILDADRLRSAKEQRVHPVSLPIFISRESLRSLSTRWVYFTDEILEAQGKTQLALEKKHDRIVDMYSYAIAAAEAEIQHEVVDEREAFNPGYELSIKKGYSPLFGRYAYPFHVCGKTFDKGLQYNGTVSLACKQLQETVGKPPEPVGKPPDVKVDLASCSYGEATWKSGGGSYAARKLALQMWQVTWALADKICRPVRAAESMVRKTVEALGEMFTYTSSFVNAPTTGADLTSTDAFDFSERLAWWSHQCYARVDDGPCTPPRPWAERWERRAEASTDDTQVVPWIKSCDRYVRPLEDSDTSEKDCTYKPSAATIQKYKQQKIDMAVLCMRDEDNTPKSTQSVGVKVWRKYANFHKYKFYDGLPNDNPEKIQQTCPGLEFRSAQWRKPCAILLILTSKEHDYIIVVDTHTYPTRPRLPLEPLFAQTGIFGNTGKTIAVAEEWGSCWGGGRPTISGNTNTGIIFLKKDFDTIDALKNWYNEPMECIPDDTELLRLRDVQWRNHGGRKWRGYGLIPGGWLSKDPNPDRCKILISALHGWPWDQVGFHLSVVEYPRWRHIVVQLKAGCPFNSPWADFIPNLVKGTVAVEYYDPADRDEIMKRMQRCTDHAFGQLDDYFRCSMCELLPQKLADGGVVAAKANLSWTLSCGERFVSGTSPDSQLHRGDL